MLPQITFKPNVQVDDVCAESQSRSPQQLVLDALDYKSSAIGCKKVCLMSDHISNKRKHMRRIWKRAQVDGWLAIWLKAVPYKDWPYQVAKYIWDKLSPDIDCGSMQADNCHPLNNHCCKHRTILWRLTIIRVMLIKFRLPMHERQKASTWIHILLGGREISYHHQDNARILSEPRHS